MKVVLAIVYLAAAACACFYLGFECYDRAAAFFSLAIYGRLLYQDGSR